MDQSSVEDSPQNIFCVCVCGGGGGGVLINTENWFHQKYFPL